MDSRHLLRLLASGFAAVLVAGCTEIGSTATSITTPATSLGPTTTSTTTTSTTTTTEGGMTIEPNLPSALSRSEIPWDEVGDGWYVVLYDSSRAGPATQSEIREGPVVLYLVNHRGDRYEVAVWPAGGSRPHQLVDAVGTWALVDDYDIEADRTFFHVVDMRTGETTVVHEPGSDGDSRPIESRVVALTRPEGVNLVVYLAEDDVEWLERRTRDGETLDILYEQIYAEDPRTQMSWLYGYTGESLIVSHRDGLAEVSNQGKVLGDLWAPDDTFCDPVRWWDADTFLATCYGLTEASAPLDDHGNVHNHYGRLWLLETDGSVGVAMTEYPDQPPIVVDFGYHDAWPTENRTFIQWSGDCGASGVHTLQPDGTGALLVVEAPSDGLYDGVQMIDIIEETVTVYGWQGCDGAIGSLFTVDLDGRFLDTLVPPIGDSRGVIAVSALGALYP